MRLEGWPRATTFRAAILRDARLRQAPQDEDRRFEDAFVLGASRKRCVSKDGRDGSASFHPSRREPSPAGRRLAPQDEVGASLDTISFTASGAWSRCLSRTNIGFTHVSPAPTDAKLRLGCARRREVCVTVAKCSMSCSLERPLFPDLSAKLKGAPDRAKRGCRRC